MPIYKVKYQGELREINWTGRGKPSKDELRLALSNDTLEKDAPPPLNDNYKLPEPGPIPKPSLFTPQTKIEKFVRSIDPQAFDETRPDRQMFAFDSNKMADIASKAPRPLQKPLGFLGSAIGEEAATFASDPESVLVPGMFGAVRRGGAIASVLDDLPEPSATSLHIPDTPKNFANEPIRRGSTTYGIRPRPTDDPLLSHVPERYQPTSPVQAHFDNMLPATMRERIKGAEALGDDFVPPAPPNRLPEPMMRNEVRGSTLDDMPEMAADTGIPELRGSSLDPNLAPPGDYKAPSMWSNIMNLTKSAKTTLDLSAPLRQGLPRIHTKEYWGSIKPMFKSLMSDEGYQAVIQELQNKPSLPVARHAGLAVFEREEQIASNLAEKIPGIGKLAKASNRAYDAFIKKLRMDTFENLINDAVKSGVDVNPKFTKNLAEVINTSTGRGTLGDLERHAGLLNNVFFSPKFISSRVQMLNPQYYMKLDPITRKEAIRSTLSLVSFGTTLGGLASLAGAEVEGDSTSSDYGKIKIGNSRIDPFAGMQQYVVLLSKIAQQQQKSPITGNVREFNGKYGSPTALGATGRFLQNKLNPILGFGAKLLEGTDFAGKPINIPKEVLLSFIPMLAEDTADLLANEPELLPTLIPSTFGMGVQRFKPREEDPSKRPSRKSRTQRKRRQ